MFIKDGIVYGRVPEKTIRVEAVKVLPDMIMLITFNNGEIRLFDASVLTGPAFEPLKEPEIFMFPTIDHGVITWNKGNIDCAPEYMYKHSYEYSMVV